MDCTKLFTRTYAISNGVAGCDPPIVCAKLLAPTPGCLACALGRPVPFAGAPKPQLVVLPRIRLASGQGNYMKNLIKNVARLASSCSAISLSPKGYSGSEEAVGLHSRGMAGLRD